MYSTKIKDLMTKNIVAIDHNDNVERVAQLMVEKKVGSVLVYREYEPIGIITKRDILERVVTNCQDPCKVKAKDIATENLIVISEDDKVLDALRLMNEHKIKRILVKNPETYELAGIITTYDLVAAFNVLNQQS